MRPNSTLVSLVILICGTMLVGCTPRESLTLSGDELASAACESQQTIAVDELAALSTVECDPLGSTIEFPDGTLLQIESGNGSSSSTSSALSYSYFNVGALGIVASQYVGECVDLQVWGPPAAVKKVTEAFGDDLGNC